jgi:dGTPase
MEEATSEELEHYRRLISKQRTTPSEHPKPTVTREAASDRARVLYASAFRRLQHKAQVFPLSRNAAVRSRLTHSLEVADVGRDIASRVADRLLGGLDADLRSAIPLIVETGCLMHDIGNPPFGHFAETAIQRWFGDNLWTILSEHKISVQPVEPGPLWNDLLHFDGNPQGVRTVLRLQGRTEASRLKHGMNLTLSQLLTGVKYASDSINAAETGTKPGYFASEAKAITDARSALGVPDRTRFPLTYLVEAADDIAYCISDLEDGLETGVLDGGILFDALSVELTSVTLPTVVASALDDRPSRGTTSEWRDWFVVLKTEMVPHLISSAAEIYADNHGEFLDGQRDSLFAPGNEDYELLEGMKRVTARLLYSAPLVERPLRLGFSSIHGLLDYFSALLRLSLSDFDTLLQARDTGDRRAVRKGRLDPELLASGLLPPRYIANYRHERENSPSGQPNAWEIYCRCHLVLDYLAGMTDDFALRTFHEVGGVAQGF